MFLALLLATAIVRPAAPTVGDPITIDFPRPVVVQPSPAYEIVAVKGTRVVVRTFAPRPFVLTAIGGATAYRARIPVRSVLAKGDSMKPAPLAPPKPQPASRVPQAAIAIAALAAVAIWVAAWFLARRRAAAGAAIDAMPPLDRFRTTVQALRHRPVAMRWAALAGATRAYLAARGFGPDLTTTELLRALRNFPPQQVPPQNAPALAATAVDWPAVQTTIADVLRHGDLEKFSPWGAPPADFDTVAERALAIPDAFEQPPDRAAGEAA